MNKYRKKPVVIEAFQMLYQEGAHQEWPDWFREAMFRPQGEEGGAFLHANGRIVIFTLEGLLEIGHGDYVIQGVKKEIYPCKPDIFDATYEKVTDE